MKKGFITIIVSAWMIILAHAPSEAYTVTINFDPGTTQIIPGITTYADGATMAGMLVTSRGETAIGNPILRTDTWSVSGPNKGSFGDMFYNIGQRGDTFSNPWSVFYEGSLSHLNQITFDAFPGNAVFDTSFGGEEGNPNTPGSGLGKTFTVVPVTDIPGLQPPDIDINVTYRDQVALAGQTPVGDLYRYMDIYFGDFPGFRGQPAELDFLADTDSISLVPSIHPALPWFLSAGFGRLEEV